MKTSLPKTCEICGSTYKTIGNKGRGKRCCSLPCANKYKSLVQRGERNPWWRGGRRQDQYGYILVVDNGKEPGANGKRYVLEHRLVMEKHLGRKLLRREFVHHLNGVRADNRLKNLKIVSHSTHHGDISCPRCCYKFKLK